MRFMILMMVCLVWGVNGFGARIADTDDVATMITSGTAAMITGTAAGAAAKAIIHFN